MKSFASGLQLISSFKDNDSLIDCKLNKIEVFDSNFSVSVNFNLRMRKSSQYDYIKIQCGGCKSYSFYYEENYDFYNVEIVKLFHSSDGLFYLSFDPCDESESMSDQDQDYVLCQKISAFEIEA